MPCGVVVTSVPRLRAQFRRGRHRAPLSGVPPRRKVRKIGAQVTGNQQLDATLLQVGEMLVPQYADHCFIDVLHGDVLIRRLQRHASGWTPPPGTWAQTGEQIRYPAGHFCQQAMARLDTILVIDTTPERFPAPSAPSLALSMKVEMTSVVTAPLCTHGALLGVISIARSGLTSRSQPHFTTSDRDLLSAVASKVATAIDSTALCWAQPSARGQLAPSPAPAPGRCA
jgi:GAF domain-containing protein